MEHRARLKSIGVVLAALAAPFAWCAPLSDSAFHDTAHDIFKQLIEINTTDSIGSTTLAAQAMAKRLLDAGFPAADVTVLGPNDRKGNMVARYRGKPGSKLKPVLSGLGISILSTSRGVISDREARQRKLGGEILCEVW